MSWIESLYRTYELNYGKELGSNKIRPVFHIQQKAHICVAVDIDGNFISARVIDKNEPIKTIPVTKKSGGRSNGSRPHALFDKLIYVAGDFVDYQDFKNEIAKNESKKSSIDYEISENKEKLIESIEKKRIESINSFNDYINQLNGWCESKYSLPKICAIKKYLEKKSLIKDLNEYGLLPLDENGKLFTKKPLDVKDEIFSAVSGGNTSSALVIFECYKDGDPEAELWENEVVQKSWVDYFSEEIDKQPNDGEFGICYVSGKESSLCYSNPKNIRFSSDGAKLISSNDANGFTFRGRFEDQFQAYGISDDVTQKAHSALSWLIQKQGKMEGDQTIVAWAIADDVSVPSPICDEFAFGNTENSFCGTAKESANALNLKISGYRSKLNTKDMVVLMIESTGKGNMAITYYNKLSGSDFLDNIEHWHTNCAWNQNLGKEKKFYGAVSPREIAKVIYDIDAKAGEGEKKRIKNTVARLLPCIMERKPLPSDIVNGAIRSVCKASIKKDDKWKFNRNLSVACSLYNFKSEEKYDMSLDKERKTRGYLYGRLLAVVDYLESKVLEYGGNQRSTNAMRLMQRFSNRPYSTWEIIKRKINPYEQKLERINKGMSVNLNKIINEIHSKFEYEDFCSDKPLDGGYLLGFYCQRNDFYTKKESNDSQTKEDEDEKQD